MLTKETTLQEKKCFRAFFNGRTDLAEDLLQAITGKPDIQIVSIKTGADLSRVADGTEVVLDLVCRDSDGTVYGVQMESEDLSVWWAVSVLNVLGIYSQEKGQEDSETPEVWSIFICQSDPSGGGKLLHHEQIARIPLSDRYLRHLVYLNCSYDAEKAAKENRGTGLPAEQEKQLLELIHDFREGDPNEMVHASYRDHAKVIMVSDEAGSGAEKSFG